MTSGNQVVSHLQQQRTRIQGMLSPGRKDQPVGINAPLSPVKSDFAGRKFLLAAKKMRVLGDKKLSSLFSRDVRSLSTEIASKFRDVEKIIHVNPKTIRDGSIWSDVETTLPGSIQPVQQPERLEGGMLQQGSVIQKFSSVPKPGQSLESFRQQIESQPRPSKSPVSRNKKAPISPGDRLFSRIQEITPAQKAAGISEQALPIEEKQPEDKAPQTVSTPPIQPQAADLPITVQRQADLPEVKTQANVITDEANSLQTVEGNVPQLHIPESPDEVEPVASIWGSLPILESPDESAGEELPVEKKIAPKPELKKAIPVKKEKDVAKQSQVMKALPVNKPTDENASYGLHQLWTRPDPALPVSKPTVEPASATVIHRQPITPLKPTVEKAADEESKSPKTPAAGITEEVTTEEKQPISKLNDAVEPLEGSRKNDEQAEPVAEDEAHAAEVRYEDISSKSDVDSMMPLRQVLADRRQKAENVIRRVQPVKLQQSLRPVLTHSALPMLASEKVSRKVVSRPAAEMPAVRQASPAFQPGGAQSVSVASPGRPAEFQEMEDVDQEMMQQDLSMPIAQTKFIPDETAAIERRDKQTKATQQSAPVSRPVPRIAAAANIVHRQWEEHTGVEFQGSGGDAGQSAGENGESGSLDLEALAEDVFPFVKRILEIEMNRGSGKLR